MSNTTTSTSTTTEAVSWEAILSPSYRQRAAEQAAAVERITGDYRQVLDQAHRLNRELIGVTDQLRRQVERTGVKLSV